MKSWKDAITVQVPLHKYAYAILWLRDQPHIVHERDTVSNATGVDFYFLDPAHAMMFKLAMSY